MKIFCKVICFILVLMLATVAFVGLSSAQIKNKTNSIKSIGNNPASMPSFTEISTGSTTDYYSCVAMGDIDGVDHYAEIVCGGENYVGSTTGLYLWQYSGTGWSKQTITSTGSYGSVVLADIDGDGILDIVAAGETQWSSDKTAKGVVLYKGAHTGTSISFTPLTSPYSAASCDCVAVGDIQGNGHNSIVAGAYNAGIKVLVNGGGSPPTWTTVSLSTATTETTGIALGDVSGDGKPDIIATNYDGGNAAVYLCTATSPSVTYGPAHTSGLNTGTAFGIAIGDFNGDGKNDLAIGTKTNSLKVYTGNNCSGADTTWWTDIHAPIFDPGSTKYNHMQVSTGDINKDGRLDIAVGIDGLGIGILQNNGGSPVNFTNVNPTGIPTSGSRYGCLLYDFDGDGDLDLGTCGFGTGMHFYKNNLYVAPEFNSASLIVMITCGMAIISVIAVHSRKLK